MIFKAGCAIPFFLSFGLLWSTLVCSFDAIIVYGFANQMLAKSFPTTTGVVLSAGIEPRRDNDGTTYEPVIEYQYKVEGKEYISARFRYGGFEASSDHSFATDRIANYPVNSQVTVHYNPADPSNAVLHVDIGSEDIYLAIFMMPFNMVMLCFCGFGVTTLKRRLLNPPAGGVTIIKRHDGLHVRLPRVTPAFVGVVVATVISLASTLTVIIFSDSDPSLSIFNLIWIIIILSAGTGYSIQWLGIASGKKDLVIDQTNSMLTLPQTFGRKGEVMAHFDMLSSIDVNLVAHHEGKGLRYTYAPTLNWKNENSESPSDKRVDWHNENRANEFVEWLRAKMGFGGNQPSLDS